MRFRAALTAALALAGCLEEADDPRPPAPVADRDGGHFDPGPRPQPQTQGGSGAGYGSGSGAAGLAPDRSLQDQPDDAADAADTADAADFQEAEPNG